MCWGGFFNLFFYTDIEDALCFLAVYNSFKWSATILPVTSRVLSKGGGLSVGPGSELAEHRHSLVLGTQLARASPFPLHRVRYTSLPLFHAALPHCYNHCLAEQRLQ